MLPMDTLKEEGSESFSKCVFDLVSGHPHPLAGPCQSSQQEPMHCAHLVVPLSFLEQLSFLCEPSGDTETTSILHENTEMPLFCNHISYNGLQSFNGDLQRYIRGTSNHTGIQHLCKLMDHAGATLCKCKNKLLYSCTVNTYLSICFHNLLGLCLEISSWSLSISLLYVALFWQLLFEPCCHRCDFQSLKAQKINHVFESSIGLKSMELYKGLINLLCFERLKIIIMATDGA